MPTPKAGYWRDGKQLPGVTTVLKQEDGSGLIAAANKMGLKSREIYGPKGEWSQAADIGTATHARIQAAIDGNYIFNSEDFTIPVREQSHVAFGSFLRWAKGKDFAGGECEVGLVHPAMDYGGTIDYLHKGQGIIFDWKSNASPLLTYPDKLYGQIGAYVMLAESHGIEILSTTVVRFPKDGGDAEELVIDPRSEKGMAGRMLFLALLAAYKEREIINRKEPLSSSAPSLPIQLGLLAKP